MGMRKGQGKGRGNKNRQNYYTTFNSGLCLFCCLTIFLDFSEWRKNQTTDGQRVHRKITLSIRERMRDKAERRDPLLLTASNNCLILKLILIASSIQRRGQNKNLLDIFLHLFMVIMFKWYCRNQLYMRTNINNISYLHKSFNAVIIIFHMRFNELRSWAKMAQYHMIYLYHFKLALVMEILE